MKKNKRTSRSVDNDISSIWNNSNNKKNENKKSPLITIKNNNKINNNISSSSLLNFQNDNKYFIERNYTQQVPSSNFLEEMYLKYSKNLQKYFLKNQTGLKLVGNKYFKNLTVEEYMKQNKLNKEQFIKLLKGGIPVENKFFPNNKNLENIKKEDFFLTPLPNKSRQLLITNKEKSDFIEAERSAVVMRTFEYTHGIRSKVGIYEYKKFLLEQKQKLINLMLNAAKKIQRWWKRKYHYIIKNRDKEKFAKRLLIYNDFLIKKKTKLFYDKIYNYIKFKLNPKFKSLFENLKDKAQYSIKKFYSIFDWINKMNISYEIKFQIIDDCNLFIKKRKNENIDKKFGFISNYLITKNIIASKTKNSIGKNTKKYQIKKIIFLQKIFKKFLKIKKEKEIFINSNRSQFSYINPNKLHFCFSKEANSGISKTDRNYKSNFISKNNNDEILIKEEKAKTIRGQLPTISYLSKKKDENDDINKNNDNKKYEYMNKKSTIYDMKKKFQNLKENKIQNNNDTKIDNDNNDIKNKSNKNKGYKKIENNILNPINSISRNNSKIKQYNKNIKNKDKNKNGKQKNNLSEDQINSSKRINSNKNNKSCDNKKNLKKELSDKQNIKLNINKTLYDSRKNSKNNNSSFIENIIESKKKNKNKLPYINKNRNKQKFINSNSNNDFYSNSSSYMNKQVSFGVDNLPSKISKKNNLNSFFENDNINNISGLNYNNNFNKIEEENNNKNNYHIESQALKNAILPQKYSSIKNVLLIEEIEDNELNFRNKKNKEENKNNLLLIDSLEIENNKKIDKNIIKVINSNEYFEKSLPPEINFDNYQKDSTLDYKDKKFKSNQKTISTSALLHLDSSNNQINREQVLNYQMFGQISLTFIHRPLIPNGNYISKIRKKDLSSKINKNLNNLINIKINFCLRNFIFSNNINKSILLKKYMKHWKYITEKEAEPFTYSKIITSICTSENNDKGEYFSYYSKINKSNEENDFIFLRISLGYKLLRKVFCGNDLKIFLYLLKRRRRKNNRAKTYIYKKHSKNILNLLDFKIKLPILLNKIFTKKYCGMFYHKFLYFSLNLNNNIEYDLENNNVCSLVREGYKKGYFELLYNILKERFNYENYNSGLKFESFIKILFSLHE